MIVSDYGGGLVTPAFWRRALSAARGEAPPLVLVDSRYGLTGFTGMTACTPNESEVEALLGMRINDDRSGAGEGRPRRCWRACVRAPC